jgi:hypothetical protein
MQYVRPHLESENAQGPEWPATRKYAKSSLSRTTVRRTQRSRHAISRTCNGFCKRFRGTREYVEKVLRYEISRMRPDDTPSNVGSGRSMGTCSRCPTAVRSPATYHAWPELSGPRLRAFVRRCWRGDTSVTERTLIPAETDGSFPQKVSANEFHTAPR